MAKRPHPKGASTNPGQGPWTECMRCGLVKSMDRIVFQYDFMGGSTPQNTGLRVCVDTCVDDLMWQAKLLILPPDPAPIPNTFPTNYAVDETNWLTTQDDSIITTQDGVPIVTPVPRSPSVPGNTVVLNTVISAPAATITAMYMDFFIGDPAGGAATSVLSVITGSATRTDIASLLEVNGSNQAVNPAKLTVTSACSGETNVGYVGFYDAASAGNLIASGPVSATWPTLVVNAVVQFNPLGILIQL